MPALQQSRPDREAGNAVVIAILVLAVCLSLALVGVQVALSTGRASGVDRQRVLAVAAAEAGIDSAFSALQSGTLDPPCSLPTASVQAAPDTTTYDTTLTYYSAASPDTPLACPLAGAVPARALIRSTAQTTALGGGGTRGVRTMEALVTLTRRSSTTLTKAIYSNAALSFDNKTTVLGSSGADGDFYTNSDVVCGNNTNVAGSIYTQGSATLANGCTLAGSLWAKNAVQRGSAWNGSVGGFVKSGTAGITLDGPGAVTGNLSAAGSINHSSCPAKCFPDSPPGNPPFQPFPILRGDDATMNAWIAAGYTKAPDVTSCGGISSSISAASGPKALLRAHCGVSLQSDLVLDKDLALFAYGGITTERMTVRSSVPGTKRTVYFVVPYDAVASLPCSSPVVDTDKLFALSGDIELLVYSPCDITYSNSSSHVGQIYGGSKVTVKNNFTMQYRPMPVFGIDPSSLTALGYTPSIVYKRENR